MTEENSMVTPETLLEREEKKLAEYKMQLVEKWFRDTDNSTDWVEDLSEEEAKSQLIDALLEPRDGDTPYEQCEYYRKRWAESQADEEME
jgi:hypothetical protein|tara:strand:+ start:5178 stop:5447 length:270 start_codon:yes stop_codon:yes gene_type:complete